MTQTLLTSQQRNDLIALLAQRLTRMPDQALIEMERMTRPSGVHAAGPSASQTVQKAPPNLAVETRPTLTEPSHVPLPAVKQDQVSPTQPFRSAPSRQAPTSRVGRREWLTYCTGGVLLAALGGAGLGWGGTGWWLYRQNQNITAAGDRMDNLEMMIQDAVRCKTTCQTNLQVYTGSAPDVKDVLGRFTDVKTQLDQDYQAMNLSDFLKPEIVNPLLSDLQAAEIFFPALRSLADGFSNLIRILRDSLDLYNLSTEMIPSLNLWFIDKGGVNQQVFQALDAGLFHDIDLVSAQMDYIVAFWKENLPGEVSTIPAG